jgi:hypothetical protein
VNLRVAMLLENLRQMGVPDGAVYAADERWIKLVLYSTALDHELREKLSEFGFRRDRVSEYHRPIGYRWTLNFADIEREKRNHALYKERIL